MVIDNFDYTIDFYQDVKTKLNKKNKYLVV